MANLLSQYFNNAWTTPVKKVTPLSVTNTVSRTLPGGDTYKAPVVTPPVAPVAPVVQQNKPIFTPQNNPVEEQPIGEKLPPHYFNPATGALWTPQEFAENLSKVAPQGNIPKYAGDALTNPNQSQADLSKTANTLTNTRNDIAVGETDPYKAASASGIAYSPAELSAIEKAYAGIYDPALQDVFGRLKTKQDEDKAALDQKNKLAEMAQQHLYDVELKKTPTYSDSNSGGGGTSGTVAGYIAGENPTVDAWVDRINRGEATIKDITGVKNQGLRDAVMRGLSSTKYESAKSLGSLETINEINKMLINPELENISGPMGQFTGGIFGKAATAKALYNTVSGKLQTLGASLAKGQGQISDYERKIFKDASVPLNRGMNDEEFRRQLVNMRGALSVASGLTASTIVIDPTNGESEVMELDRDGLIAAEKNGLVVEFVDDTIQQ